MQKNILRSIWANLSKPSTPETFIKGLREGDDFTDLLTNCRDLNKPVEMENGQKEHLIFAVLENAAIHATDLHSRAIEKISVNPKFNPDVIDRFGYRPIDYVFLYDVQGNSDGVEGFFDNYDFFKRSKDALQNAATVKKRRMQVERTLK